MEPTPLLPAANNGATAVRGSCLCGSVVYEATTLPVDSTTCCHCVQCQKSSGSPFLTFGLFHNSTIRWLSGDGSPTPDIKLYYFSDWAARGTCGKCGSPLFMKYHATPDGTFITMGTIDVSRSLPLDTSAVREHIFLKEKVPWLHIPEDGSVAMHQGNNEGFAKRLETWIAAGKPQRDDL